MRVAISRGNVNTVNIQGDFSGPYINLDIPPAAAYDLFLKLEAKREELRDLATNYYDCSECGQTHPNSVKVCIVNKVEDE
jgi:hypothetical protein